MRQFIQFVRFEFAMSFKSFFGVYMMVAPLAIVLVLRAFVPTVESTTGTLAVVDQGPHAVDEAVLERASAFAEIERYESVEAVETKLRAAGSAEGLYWDPEQERYISLLERNIPDNALFSAGARVVRRHAYETGYPDREQITTVTSRVPPELGDRTPNSPVATTGGSIFLAFMSMMMGFILGLSIVRDKELKTDRAVRVTPVTKAEYFLAKAVLPILVFAAYAAIGLWILGLLSVNMLQVYLVVVVSFVVLLLFGVLIGAMAHNETEGLGLAKATGTLAILAVLGGTLLPDSWQWLVYWVPVYWVFNAIDGILTLTATWADVLRQMGVMAGICLLVFLGLRKRIAAGLS